VLRQRRSTARNGAERVIDAAPILGWDIRAGASRYPPEEFSRLKSLDHIPI